MTDPNCCFKLRIIPNNIARPIIIRAYDDMAPSWDSAGRIRLTCKVTQGGTVIFPKGQLCCALHGTSDGIEAKNFVMSLVAMHPDARGGEGADYYEGYTQSQLDWANEHGEHLDQVRLSRYCDEAGNVLEEE